MTRRDLSEDARYRIYRIGAHAAWWGAFTWTGALTYVNLTRPATALPGTFQRVSGLFIILLMGIAIACGSTLARMRLAKTITNVFEIGMKVATGKLEASRAEMEIRMEERDTDSEARQVERESDKTDRADERTSDHVQRDSERDADRIERDGERG